MRLHTKYLNKERRALLALLSVIFCAILFGCNAKSELQWHQEEGYIWAKVDPGFWGETGFQVLDASQTNINFINKVSKKQVAQNRHYLNGSGVAAGDIDGDGWADIYFASLNGPNKLYKNLGGFLFKDITKQANVRLEGNNSTGVVFADVDGDSDLDLLVSSLNKSNQLLINNGKGHFTLKKDSGLGTSKGSTTMTLADIDSDGDLDLYLVNYKVKTVRDIYGPQALSLQNTVKVVDGKYKVLPPFDNYYGIVQTDKRPYRNEYGTADELYISKGNGLFEKVSGNKLKDRFKDSEGNPLGLARDWGLTAKFQDLNNDNLPDLYVCNDFWSPDRIWINQGNGSFRAIDENSVRNFSFSSMGIDASDINRDGYTDLFVTEMLSPNLQDRMQQYSDHLAAIDGRPQFNKNSLYLNRGDNTYAELAYFSGLEASGWSWATHFMDIDLDGYEDLIVTTGNGNDYQDLDTQMEINRRVARHESVKGILEYPILKLGNKFFRNNKDLTFSDKSIEWGFNQKDISHGLATADFDHDGDLDFVINRFNEHSIVYQNESSAPRIAVRLKSHSSNSQAIGAKITLQGGPVKQIEQVVSGGDYLSSSEPLVVFAADEENSNHILTIDWPDGRQTKLNSIKANRIYEIDQEDKKPVPKIVKKTGDSPIFKDISNRLTYDHPDDVQDKEKQQPLVPIELNNQGPGLALLDYDHDSDDDLVITDGRKEPSFFKNDGSGYFKPDEASHISDQSLGNPGAVIGWGDSRGFNLVLGNADSNPQKEDFSDVLTYNLKEGKATLKQKLMGTSAVTGPVSAADYDGDGDIDLFVGGRFKPDRYPENTSSRLFKNENGTFYLDEKNSQKLRDIGLVTSSVFSDYDSDGDQDLIIARAWDSIILFENEDGNFRDVSPSLHLDSYKGWWRGIATGDINNDGRPDIIATNIGLNTPYQIKDNHPLKMYYQDFNFDGVVDIVETEYDEQISRYIPRRKLYEFDSLPVLMRHISSHHQFSTSTLDKIFQQHFNKVSYKQLNTLAHMLFINKKGGFEAHPLPSRAQWSTASYVGIADYNNDGNEDLFLSQNGFFDNPNTQRIDAGRGLWLQGNGRGELSPIPGQKTGIEIYGEQRAAALGDIDRDGRVDLAVSQYGDKTKLYLNTIKKTGLLVQLIGTVENPNAIGSSVRLVYENGSKGPVREIQAGSGYWSQNSFVQVLGTNGAPAKLEIRWFNGKTESVPLSDNKHFFKIKF